MTKEQKNKRQREYRKKIGDIHTKRYEKTKPGFLMRSYRNMKSRILGIQKKKHHLYFGKELIEKEQFYNWSLNNNEFHYLFKQWQESNYQRRLTPSVDRVDSRKGYSLDNMEWVPFYINCSRVAKNQKILIINERC